MPTIRIGLVFDYAHGYCRGVLRGVRSFIESKPGWILTIVPPEPRSLERLRQLRPAGLIAQVFSNALAETLLTFQRPLVNVSAILPDLPVPRVVVDDEAVGRIAAAHLLDRKLRHFGFVGHLEHAYSLRREAGFREAIEAAGYRVETHRSRGSLPQDPKGGLWALGPGVRRWLARLPRPVGVFTPNDVWGHQLLEDCRQVGLRVPDDVAVLGVDNDELLCTLARPSLTSVAPPAERIGFEAATLLHERLSSSRIPTAVVKLPPLGIVTRQSTDVLAVDDPDVAAAVRFIRQRSQTPIQVRDVLRAVPVSRRTLERRFQQTLGRGIGAEIRHARLERAHHLLASTEQPIAEVARRTGFSDAKQFAATFRRETGQTPTRFRRSHRTATNADFGHEFPVRPGRQPV